MARSSRASTLALVAATALVLVSLVLFALWFGSANFFGEQHRTAADAAAISAAEDIGRIVYKSPECGWVSLTGAPPNGSYTLAGDQFVDQVHSINELIGTARLDYIIASQLNGGDQLMESLALNDEANALKARDELISIINASLTIAGSPAAKDINGRVVTPYSDAMQAYLANQAHNSFYKPPSMKLSLGCIEGGAATAIPIPNFSVSTVSASGNFPQQRNSCYVSDMDIPYNGNHFVFAAVTDAPALANVKKFRQAIITATGGSTGTSSGGLSIVLVPPISPPVQGQYVIPACVKVDADQDFDVQGRQWTTHYSSCATAGGFFRLPSTSQLTISFPDGPVPEFCCLQDLYANTLHYASNSNSGGTSNPMTKTDCDLYTAAGDFPVDSSGAPGTLSQNALSSAWAWNAQGAAPWDSAIMKASDIARMNIYHWIRSAGTTADVDAVTAMQTHYWYPDAGSGNPTGSAFDANMQPTQLVEWWTTDPGTGQKIDLGQGLPGGAKIPQGFTYVFRFNQSLAGKSIPKLGTVANVTPYPYMVAADGQLYAENEGLNAGAGATPIQNAIQSDVAGWTIPAAATAPPHPPSHAANGSQSTIQLCLPTNPPGPPHGHGSPGGGALVWAKQSVQISSCDEATNNDSIVDVYFRDQIMQPGGGKHGGSPTFPLPAYPCVGSPSPPCNNCTGQPPATSPPLKTPGTHSTLGTSGGAPIMITELSDFANTNVPKPPFVQYSTPTSSMQTRPTYAVAGIGSEIRFRRRIDVGALGIFLGNYNAGYVGQVLPP